MDIQEACKLIVGRSPQAAQAALVCLKAARHNSPVLAARYEMVLAEAISDPEAGWTAQERADLASALVDTGEPERKSQMLSLRLSGAEMAFVADQAEKAGVSVSDYIRSKIL